MSAPTVVPAYAEKITQSINNTIPAPIIIRLVFLSILFIEKSLPLNSVVLKCYSFTAVFLLLRFLFMFSAEKDIVNSLSVVNILTARNIHTAKNTI